MREAGFEPNRLNSAFSDEFLFEQFILLTRQLGHVPTGGELRVERQRDPEFPSANVYARFGPKRQLVATLLRYCEGRPEHADVRALLQVAQPHTATAEVNDLQEASSATYGFVYLVRGHPGEYKIGRTNLVDRRLSELGPLASVEHVLIHEIKTDDPVGVERYWHNRFSAKRMRGEWFKLDAADVRAFKRWKKLY